MAYVGRIQIHPNHPFAHDCILLVPKRPEHPRLPIGRRGITGWVSWGYERHDFRIGYARWRRIRAGERVVVRSVGWYEGNKFPICWVFDLKAENSLVVSYGNDGADGYIGSIHDAHVEEK